MKISVTNIIGGVMLATGIAFLFYAIPLIYIGFTAEAGINRAWSLMYGVPFFLVSACKIRLAISFLVKDSKNLILASIVVALLEGLVGYYFINNIIPRPMFAVYLMVLYIPSIVYLLRMVKWDVAVGKVKGKGKRR